jgi:hypothetical protein
MRGRKTPSTDHTAIELQASIAKLAFEVAKSSMSDSITEERTTAFVVISFFPSLLLTYPTLRINGYPEHIQLQNDVAEYEALVSCRLLRFPMFPVRL